MTMKIYLELARKKLDEMSKNWLLFVESDLKKKEWIGNFFEISWKRTDLYIVCYTIRLRHPFIWENCGFLGRP